MRKMNAVQIILLFVGSVSFLVWLGCRSDAPKPTPAIHATSTSPSSPNIINDTGSIEIHDDAPAEPDYVKKLRAVTEKRKMSFRAYCYEGSERPDTDNYAIAWPSSGKEGEGYIEDGGVPTWIKSGRTQEIAVRRLIISLEGPPTWTPEHRPSAEEKSKRKRECSPEIQGGPQ